MFDLLWLAPAMPFAGFLALALIGHRLSRRSVAGIGVVAVGLAAMLALVLGLGFVANPPRGSSHTQTLWQWLAVAGFAPSISLRLDALSLVMVTVVSFVGFLILLYSVDYMAGDDGYRRFFAYMNLFIGAMLTLVLADDLLLLLLGWEGVGLSSYLLIGFWYRDPANGRAARKAFVVTRIGDTALLVGLFLLFNDLGTLRVQELMVRAPQAWLAGTIVPTIAAGLLLGGALGKSAQLPLQVWLPDAMAGPTPVSALIHAATMVTAGVYLVARTNVLFALAPDVLWAIAVVGAATLLYAGCSALAQSDIKRALAYSTISQIGYMFLALGVGAWSAAIFHLMTHAFFKALLFLSAGVVILALNHEQNMFRMGGLRQRQPLAFWTFLIGSASLSAVPLVTAGFYSKDAILFQAWSSPLGSPWLWLAGAVGALLTGLYSFRMVFLTFFGPGPSAGHFRPRLAMRVPLAILAALSLLAGLVELPGTLGNTPALSRFLRSALPEAEALGTTLGTEAWLQAASGVAGLLGIYLAYRLFLVRTRPQGASSEASAIILFWRAGWGFDRLYDAVFVRPYIWLSKVNKDDAIDRAYRSFGRVFVAAYAALSATQSGKVRWYASALALGVVALVAIGLLA